MDYSRRYKMTRKGKVISFRIDENIYDIWIKAIKIHTDKIRKEYPEAEISQARIFKKMMMRWIEENGYLTK